MASRAIRRVLPILLAGPAPLAMAHPYDFSAADTLLNAQLSRLDGHVAVIVRQHGVELYRFQAGDIGYDTRTRLASFTKTVSAGVILALRDEGLLSLDERLGDAFPLFQANGLGDPTITDAWGMRHGIDTLIAYEHDSRFTLAESVTRIGATGFLDFPAGEQLGYDGSGMQTVGRLAEVRTGQAWAEVARTRIFEPCGMPQADYLQFDPNPSIPGGLRSTAGETIGYAQMIIDRGVFGGKRVLSEDSVEEFFTNRTRGLPVFASPWPPTHPLYPYGTDPDYAFGCWVLAENPDTEHVEEIVGAGAWGSFMWVDRRRGLTAVLITDIPAGSQGSLDAALGLFQIAREQTEQAQATGARAVGTGDRRRVVWQAAPGATASRVYGSASPIRDLFDLRDATALTVTARASVTAPFFPYYAVTSVFDGFENTALIPGVNATPAPCPADFNGDATADFFDYLDFVFAFSAQGDLADFNADDSVDFFDYLDFVSAFDAGC
jgi:CubicO group peptidase (beta-lactamase class C family)